MRTIKFRGKGVLSAEWVYGGVTAMKDGWCSAITTLTEDEFDSQELVYPETIGQYTGLLDKNGREIYEDDIVRDSEGRISYVKWLIQRCGFVLVYEQFDKDITGSYGKIEHLEVIGNLHDNKELIKEK